MAAHEIYAQQMSKLMHGLPLWEPEPPWQTGEVQIGDVGYVRNGHFRRLFNAAVPLGHESNALLGVPEGHEPLELSAADIHRNERYHPIGALHTASVEKFDAGFKLGA